jgi:hypothetical protein
MAYQSPKIRAEKFLAWSWSDINSQLQGLERQQAFAVWNWAAIRFSSLGTEQERYFKRYGAEPTYRRVAIVRAWLGLEPLPLI